MIKQTIQVNLTVYMQNKQLLQAKKSLVLLGGMVSKVLCYRKQKRPLHKKKN